MNVVVTGAMDHEQLALQLAGKGYWRALLVFIRMILRQPAITLLVDCVVITNVGNRRDRHRHAIEIWIAKDRIKTGRTSAAPTPNTDARRVNEWPFADGPGGVCLILRIKQSHFAIDRLAPGPAARRRRAAIVDTEDYVALLRQHPMPHKRPSAPIVNNGLRRRFAIDIKQNGVMFVRVKIRRLDHPTVQLHAFANIDTEELRQRLF